MIEPALFCLLNWYDRPGEVESIFRNTAPHHEILEIDARHFSGLLRAVFDVIGDVMLADRPDWYRVWRRPEPSWRISPKVRRCPLWSLPASPSWRRA